MLIPLLGCWLLAETGWAEHHLPAADDRVHVEAPESAGAVVEQGPIPRHAVRATQRAERGEHLPAVRLPGEFEHQNALMLGCHELVRDMPGLFGDIVSALAGQVPVVAMVNDQEDHRLAVQALAQRGLPPSSVRFLSIAHDTMWARDYGPMVVRSRLGQVGLVDARYGDSIRPSDDNVPLLVAAATGRKLLHTALSIDGGNLLTNGQGVAITTTQLLIANSDQGFEEEAVRLGLRNAYGIEQLVVLEPLVNESTGHVDMFATFVSHDTVVVGAYDPTVDPVNAAVLDANAQQLAETVTANGPLRVVRIPMPSNRDGLFRSYTNVVFANGTLLLPVYPDVDDLEHLTALDTYTALLPHWKIEMIDASEVVKSGGALHCMIMNLGPLDRLPAADVMLASQSRIMRLRSAAQRLPAWIRWSNRQ